MKDLLSAATYTKLNFFLYRRRFLLTYIGIGVFSIWVEVLLLRGLQYLGLSFVLAQVLGLFAGIAFAYWFNVRFNFKVPIAKRNRAMVYFVLISIASATINMSLRRWLHRLNWSYEEGRFVISGVLFSFGYLLHRRFSFADRKQVGVAIYANGVEDIRGIRSKIGDFPDFIHIDLIDSSFGANDVDVRSYRLEAIQAHWPKHSLQVHLMTRHPSRWLGEILAYVDTVIVHHEADEDLHALFDRLRAAGKRCGLALGMGTPVEAAKPLLGKIDVLVLLSIPKPGKSGQSFQIETLERIAEINAWNARRSFSLCVDGGVNEHNIGLLNVEHVVSGSSVLNAADSARQIMRLQTSSNYEAI